MFNVLFSEELGIVHKGIQVGESHVCYKVSCFRKYFVEDNPLEHQQDNSANLEAINGVSSLATATRAQQVAREANQVESIFQRPSGVRKGSASPSSKQKFRRIAPSDEEKLYEDAREDPTLQWTVPHDLYDDNMGGNNKLM